MYVTFWGVRGTFPLTQKKGSTIGTNTSCVSVTHLNQKKNPYFEINDQSLIFDAGTGLVDLGKKLSPYEPVKANLFLTHYHHDHLMGLTGFPPFFSPNSQITFYGQPYENETVEQILTRYFAPPLFPIAFKDLPAAPNFRFYDLKPSDSLQVNNFEIQTFPLNHPQGSLAYRCSDQNKSLIYATDHEEQGSTKEFLSFLQGTDALIMDSTYLQKQWMEYHQGWGHSSCAQVASLAQRAKVKKLFLFHYHEQATDDLIKEKYLGEAQAIFKSTVLSQEKKTFLIK